MAALTLAASVLGASARAQTSGAGKPKSAPSESAPPVNLPRVPAEAGAAGPDIFLLPDESGKLRRVLGYRYEDFFEAWQAGDDAREAERHPKLAMTRLNAEASVAAEAAAVKVSMDVELKSNDWIEAPLELGTLIVRRSKIEGGADRDFLIFDPARKRFAAWLKGEPGDKRTIVLEGDVVISRDNDARRLEIELPTSAFSRVDVTSAAEPEVLLPERALVTTEGAADDQTRTRIEGVNGRLVLRWGRSDAMEFDRRQAFEAVTDTIIDVESGRLSYEGFVTLRSSGEPLDRVRVRLPRGTSASPPPEASGYDVVNVSEGDSNESPVVELRLSDPSREPPVIRIEAQQNAHRSAGGSVLRAEGFEVLGAVRQRGALAVRVNEQLHAHFEPNGRVDRTDPSELPEALRAITPLAAFNSSGVHWALEIHTQPRERKVRATPTYDLHLGSQGAVLDVALEYQITGGRTFDLRVDLRGWELSEQPIESGGAVDLVEQHVTPEQVLIMPLKDSSAQQVRLRFSLRREAGLGVHDLPLPEIKDAFVLPGELTLTCDEAWRAAAQIEDSVGVAPTPQPAVDELAGNDERGVNSQRAAAAIELQTFLPQARLTVDVSEREQLIEVKSGVLATLDSEGFSVRQRLEYDVSFQPVEELRVTAPTELLANEALELLLGGKPLPAAAVDILAPSGEASSAGERNLRLIVRLPESTLGRHVLEFRSATQLNDAQRTGLARIALPLAVADQATVSTAKIQAAADAPNVMLWTKDESGSWRVASDDDTERSADGNSAALDLVADQPVSELALRLEPRRAMAPSDVRVTAAWAQTWLAGGVRQDRYVYRFQSDGTEVTLSLPKEFGEQQAEVLLDGKLMAGNRSQPGLLSVELPTEESHGWHTLEVRRQTPQRVGSWSELRASFPRIEENGPGAPFRWQLILPPELVAVGTPAGMSAEYQLGWRGVRWGRQPTQTQVDLERWTSATRQQSPPHSTNQYLYSAFEAPTGAEVDAVRRVWVVVMAGLAALALGLAWLYTRVGRSRAFWFGVCVAAVAALGAYPEAAILMVQAVCVGGVFTLVSAATRWLLAAAPSRRATPPATGSSVASLGATQPWIPEAGAGSHVTAASAPSFHPTGSAP